MGLTGLIYAAIVVAWAIFLVPLALRRHDQAARSRSIDRFSSAMRVLSRTRGASSGRVVVAPKRTSDPVVTPSLRARTAETAAEMAAVSRPSRAGMARAAARRRRVLIVLVTAAIVTAAAAGFGMVAWWGCAVPGALIVSFLSLARRQARLANEAYWRQAAAARPQASNVVRRSATRVDASGVGGVGGVSGVAKVTRSGQPAPGGDATPDDADDEPTITLSPEEVGAATAPALAEEHVVAVSINTADGGSLWDPLPVTLPTYVDKPVAKRTIRTVDLSASGTWSAGHSPAASQAAHPEVAADSGTVEDQVDDGAVDEERIDEAPRAANA